MDILATAARVIYPAALLRCKLDARQLAAGLLTSDTLISDTLVQDDCLICSEEKGNAENPVSGN